MWLSGEAALGSIPGLESKKEKRKIRVFKLVWSYQYQIKCTSEQGLFPDIKKDTIE